MKTQLAARAKDVCLFCKSDKINFWYTFQSAYKHDAFPIFRCNSCAGSFVLPPPSEKYLAEFYNSEDHSQGGSFSIDSVERDFQSVIAAERDFPNSTVDAERMIRTAMRLTVGKRFLDVGSGYGFFSHAAKSAGLDCTAIELSENCCNIFERMNGFRPLSGSLDKGFAGAHAGRFDIVLLSQVLEHLPNPSETVAYLRSVLAPRGICVIAVPHFGSTVSKVQGRKDMFIYPPEHINYFSVSGLKSLFVDQGYEVACIETVSRFDRNKIYRKAKARPLGFAIAAILDLSLYLSDRFRRGMFINAYFRNTA